MNAQQDDLVIAKTPRDMAKIVKRVVGDRYVCACKRSNTWYMFDGRRWREDVYAGELSLAMSTTVFDFCMAHARAPEYTTSVRQLLHDIAAGFKSATVKDRIVKECMTLMYDGTLLERLDENRYLLGFENGVLDLERLVFREGVKEDYLSMSCGYDWAEEDDLEVQAYIREFIRSTQTNDDMVEYLLKSLAYMLCGDKYLEQFWIWTGRGGNGKGTLSTLLMATLGAYMYTPTCSLFTNTKPSSLNPDLAKAKGKRLIMTSKPDNVLQMSDWTRNAKIKARPMFKDPVEFFPQFGIVLQSNDTPENRDARMCVINFPYSFKEEPRFADEKQADLSLKSRFNDVRYAQQFMRMLFAYYARYVHGNQRLTVYTQ